MEMPNMAKPEERRGFFRIDDEINLFYKKVDEMVVTEPHRVSGDMLSNCSLSVAMDMASQESAVLLRRIEKDLPDVADYLKLMDTKFELLAQALMMQSFEVKETETRNVNISATGIAFDCEDALKKDDYLEIKLLLASSMAVVVTYGRVVFCKDGTSNDSRHPYFVGVDFINMNEDDRELLIKYVVKKQLQHIRDKK